MDVLSYRCLCPPLCSPVGVGREGRMCPHAAVSGSNYPSSRPSGSPVHRHWYSLISAFLTSQRVVKNFVSDYHDFISVLLVCCSCKWLRYSDLQTYSCPLNFATTSLVVCAKWTMCHAHCWGGWIKVFTNLRSVGCVCIWARLGCFAMFLPPLHL